MIPEWGSAAWRCRPITSGLADLQFSDGAFTYLDTYVGGADFLGQELALIDAAPAWAMNDYGHLLRTDPIDAVTAGATIKKILTAMYSTGRFLITARGLLSPNGDPVLHAAVQLPLMRPPEGHAPEHAGGRDNLELSDGQVLAVLGHDAQDCQVSPGLR